MCTAACLTSRSPPPLNNQFQNCQIGPSNMRRGFLFGLLLGLIPFAGISLGASGNSVVVIDAGHGGYDRGGIPGQRTPESQMTATPCMAT